MTTGSAALIKAFDKIPRIRLFGAPTPIEPCDRIRKALPGLPRIYIKRDDQLGFLCGGNKLRKLEYVMADVHRKKATAVVTIGGVHSNHARITAMVARRLGLRCVLILNGSKTTKASGNYLINKLLHIEIDLVENREDRVRTMEKVVRKLEKSGETVYPIPLGSSDPVGSLGFVAAFGEILEQANLMKTDFDHIYLASSSGGTQAGLEMGARLYGRRDIRIVGISPDDPAEDIKMYIREIMDPMFGVLGLDGSVEDFEPAVYQDYIGRGYAIPSRASKEAARLFAKTEGILLDPVYTAKVVAGILGHCRRGLIKPNDKVLFWHTGGLINLFKCGSD